MITEYGKSRIAQTETIEAIEATNNPMNAGRRIIAVGTYNHGATLICLAITKDGADAIGFGFEHDHDDKFHWGYGHYYDHAPEFYHGPAVETFKAAAVTVVWCTDEYLALAREIYRKCW